MRYLFLFPLALVFFASPVSAQELLPEAVSFAKAKVVAITSEDVDYLPGSSQGITVQEIEAILLSGKEKGKTIQLVNDLFTLEAGDTFIVRITQEQSGQTYYEVSDRERRPVLVALFVLFLASVLFFGGKQGFRSLLGLGLSFAAFWLVLIPLLLRGYSPLVVGSLIALLVLFFAIILTHGWKKTSFIAFFGTGITVIVTGILATGAIKLAHITGFASHEAVYLNFNTGGIINFSGLFLAGIIIGMLGVLDDISITQVAVVRELRHAAPHLSRKELFKRAIRVGKDHTGSLVNTLVLAYVGVALPTVLYFSTSSFTLWELINQEFFASEIIRTIIGSLGLIMTVPLVTWLAVLIPTHEEGETGGGGHHHSF